MKNFLGFLGIFSLPSLVLICVAMVLIGLFFAFSVVMIFALPIILIAFIIFYFTKKKTPPKKDPNDVIIDVEVLE